MNTSFDAAALQATPAINRGGRIVIGAVSASVECFVRERAPTRGSSSASLARRRPQSRLFRVCAAVHTLQPRVARPRRGPTSEIPERLSHRPSIGLRALVVPVRSHSVRPNYALQRTVYKSHFQFRLQRAAAEREH